jgi:hypothetical protein
MTGAQEDAIMRSLNKKNAVVGLATLKKSMATIVTRHEVYAGRFEFRAKVWQCTKYPKHIYTLDDVPHDKICPRDREPLRQISW